MNNPSPVCARKGVLGTDFDKNRRSGMTLVEVILGIAILAILAVLAVGALFYPRYLVVTSALEQNAIHAASAEIERRLSDYVNPATNVQYTMTGWTIPGADITTTIIPTNETVSGADCDYLEIRTTITYRDGRTVDLVTFRSLEVISSSR